MNHRYLGTRNDDRNKKEDKPPYSKIFVVCSKQLREDDLRESFKKFGVIEDLYMPKDRNSGEPKGIAYIQYAKTSSAAAAIEEMHLKPLGSDGKTVKVMIASNKSNCQDINESKYNRLFIKIPTCMTESDIRKDFSSFGKLDSVQVQRDKITDANRGFAYVTYKTFLDAAKAFESCDKKYKPVFAIPKDVLKRGIKSTDHLVDKFYLSSSSFSDPFDYQTQPSSFDYHISTNTLPKIISGSGYKTISVTCAPQVSQKYIEQIFNILPGIVDFKYSLDVFNGFCKALVTYKDEKSAMYAVERINKFEFPSGEVITVKPHKVELLKGANELSDIISNFKNAVDQGNPDLLQLANVISKATTLIKEAASGRIEHKVELYDKKHSTALPPSQPLESYCSIALPPLQPLADPNSRVAQRCFIVCKPGPPPPITVLRNVFSCFGDLIDVSIIPNKTFGFAKYASVRAAQEAIKCLDNAVVCGVKLRVVEADEKRNEREKRDLTFDNENKEQDIEQKRMKHEDKETKK